MDWTHNEVLNLLDAFAARNRCFTIREVSEWAAESVDAEQLHHSFSQDARFIRLRQSGRRPECFLPEREMFKWWAGLNLRLATIQQPRLTKRQLTTAMNALCPEGIWYTPPVDILDYGRQFGFVADAWTPGFYAFPFAHLLGQAAPRLMPEFKSALANLESWKLRDWAMRQRAAEAVEALLSRFDRRTYRIIKGREALPPNQLSLTLAELGRQLGCTRERVRQIESRFWQRLNHPDAALAFIAELMRRRGSPILDASQGETVFVRFLAKSVGVPSAGMPLDNAVMLGVAEFNRPAPEEFPSITAKIEDQGVGEFLEAGGLAFLARDDIGKIAAAIAQDNRNRLTKVEKAYLTLQHIGQPAHISEIANRYNEIFPGEPIIARNVRGLLLCCDEAVWAGAGTFALKEWGYGLPGGNITGTIAMIVEQKYESTGRPVHLNTIVAELGRYLPAGADMASVHFTARRCRTIQPLEGDFYIPRNERRENPGRE